MDDFEVGGRKFKLGKVNALVQFHIVRRVGPLLAELLPAMASIAKKNMDGLSEEEKLKEFAAIAAPLMTGLSKLSDADADYVLFRLLTAVEVHQPQFNSWSRVACDTGILMQDLEFPILLQVATKSFMNNLKGFFSLLPQKGSGK